MTGPLALREAHSIVTTALVGAGVIHAWVARSAPAEGEVQQHEIDEGQEAEQGVPAGQIAVLEPSKP